MKSRLLLSKCLFFLAGALLTAAPSTAFAHDNIGGDELAAAGWMLVAAIVVAVMALIAGVWAWRAGQFTNVEESKFRMIELADDYDAVMAEADDRARKPAGTADARKQGEQRSGRVETGTRSERRVGV